MTVHFVFVGTHSISRMANVFRQFLLDVEHGDVAAVRRNIQNGIDLETRDEVRRSTDPFASKRIAFAGRTDGVDSRCSVQSSRIGESASRSESERQRDGRGQFAAAAMRDGPSLTFSS